MTRDAVGCAIYRVSPVTKRASSEARKSAGSAMSIGCPARPSGVTAIIWRSNSEFAMPAMWTPSVSVSPGLMALTRMPARPEFLGERLLDHVDGTLGAGVSSVPSTFVSNIEWKSAGVIASSGAKL